MKNMILIGVMILAILIVGYIVITQSGETEPIADDTNNNCVESTGYT